MLIYICDTKGLCASELFFDVICSSKVDVTYFQRDNKLNCFFNTTDECRHKFDKIIADLFQPSAKLKALLDNTIKDNLRISLTFIDVFIQHCLSLIDDVKQKLLGHIDPKSVEALDVEQYLGRALGCQTSCPCCGRMCDVEHFMVRSEIGSETNKHRCLRGHQFRAMKGFKMENSNEPSFLICDSMKNGDKITFDGKVITWAEYKRLNPTWSFEVASQEEVNVWRARCVAIWGKIGKELCAHFGMKYTECALSMQPTVSEPIHFVFVLDDSDSMRGDRRGALIQSVTNFLTIRHKDGHLNDRVTMIIFASRASIEVFNKPIHPSLVDKLKTRNSSLGATTSYAAALKQLIKAMSDARKANDKRKFGIVFMSDGGDGYPSAQLSELNKQWHDDIYTFWCIGFGDDDKDFKVLRNMCISVNGDDSSFLNPKDKIALEAAYAEIARVDN